MRRLLIIAAVACLGTAALADGDVEFRKAIESHVQKYMDAFNSKNIDGVIATFAPDGIYLAPDGHVDSGDARRKALEGAFAAGVHDEATVTEAHRFGNAGIAIGNYVVSIPGKPFKEEGHWNATYTIDGDQIRTKILAASVAPPRPK